MRNIVVSWVAVTVSAIVLGCSPEFERFAELNYYRLAPFYQRLIDVPRLPVIFVPGIKGSRLVQCKNGKEWEDEWPCREEEEIELWGTSGNVAFFRKFDDLILAYLFGKVNRHLGQPGETIPDSQDYKRMKIKERDVLDSYRVGFSDYFTFTKYNVYAQLKEFFTKQGGYKASENIFYLPYDWRLDNRIAAVKLAQMLPRFRKQYMSYLRKEFDTSKGRTFCREDNASFEKYWKCIQSKHKYLFTDEGEIKFILVTHSMGGLIAKYFISMLEGGKDVHKLILLGVPIFGAVDSLYGLRNGEFPETFLGEVFGLHFMSQGSTRTILFSFPSVFQLLPTYEASIKGKTLAEIGLDLNGAFDPRAFEGDIQNPIFRNYLGYQVIPGEFRFQRYIGIAENHYHHFAANLLLAYLRSGQCFHRAMRINLERDKTLQDLITCKEADRVEEAEEFLKGTNSELKESWAPVSFKVRRANDKRTLGDRMVKTTIMFSGHCQPTRTKAEFYVSEGTGKKDVRFEETPKRVETGEFWSGEQLIDEYGDGRVSIFGAGAHLPGGIISDFNFVMCSSHLNLVSNPVLQYNLLRELRIN